MASVMRDKESGRFLRLEEDGGGKKELSEVERVLLGMVILYYSEMSAEGQRKVMESLCRLAFWLWGWDVGTFHAAFSRTREAYMGAGRRVSYSFEGGAEGVKLEI